MSAYGISERGKRVIDVAPPFHLDVRPERDVVHACPSGDDVGQIRDRWTRA